MEVDLIRWKMGRFKYVLPINVESTEVETHLTIKLRGILRLKSENISHGANIWTENK